MLLLFFKEVPDGAILKLPAIDEKFSGLSAPSVGSHPLAIKQLIGDLINLMPPTDPLRPVTPLSLTSPSTAKQPRLPPQTRHPSYVSLHRSPPRYLFYKENLLELEIDQHHFEYIGES